MLPLCDGTVVLLYKLLTGLQLPKQPWESFQKTTNKKVVNNNIIIIIVNIFYLNQKLSKTIHTSVISITAPETGYLDEK